MSPEVAVPVPRLVELVWGTDPPRTADKTLQSYITRLRKGLGPDSIVRVGGAYRLDVPADAVDVNRFERLLAAGDVTAALEQWTGEPLAGLERGGLSAAIDGLTERWLGAVEADLEQRIDDGTGDGPSLVGRLTELTGRYPFREGLWALLMTVLYRQGRQADALAAYRRARQHLVDGLGVEPGPRLREVEAAVLGHDERLTAGRSGGGEGPTVPRGTVSFGFCEIEHGSRLLAVGGEAARALPVVDRLVREAAADCDGHRFLVSGATFGVAFDRAGDALRWAEQVLRAVVEPVAADRVTVGVRIGLHTGDGEEYDGRYFGPSVNLAMRLAAVGHAGQLLVSEATAVLLDRNNFCDLGVFRLDDVVDDQRILQHGDHRYPPLRTERRGRGNLPRRIGPLIGRDEILETIDGAIDAAPVVTLIGPGGIGKTRLAIAAAARAETQGRGVAWLVELADVSSSSDVPRAVAAALDVVERPGRTLTESVVDCFRGRRGLLVLDNCEHVIDGAAALTSAVADSCVDLTVLTTSREGLGLPGERVVAVPTLDPAGPALELFNERAAAVSPDFDARSSREDVEEICRRLDGLPLAIELAAARTTSLTPSDLLARLDDRLSPLSGGRRGGLGRHGTLRTTIQWSYDLLTPDEQAVFQRLSVFVGPFDLAAATAVVAPTDRLPGDVAKPSDVVALEDRLDVDRLLGYLVEQSMVVVEPGPFGRRFRLLETLRQFAAEHLEEGGLTDLIAGRHAAWCLTRVDSIRRSLAGHGEVEGVLRLAELWSNLRAAVDWSCGAGDAALARRLVEPVAAEIYMRNQSEIGDWAERILAIASPDDGASLEFGMIWAARRYMTNEDRAGYERLANRYGEPAHPLVAYGRAFLHGDYGKRLSLAPQVVDELRRRGDDYLADVFEVIGVGLTLLSVGRFEEHDALVSELAARHRQAGPPTCLNWVLTFLGLSASAQGHRERSERYLAEAAVIDLPERTRTWNKPMAARVAFRRGDRMLAFETMRDYIGELLDAGDMHSARAVFVDFVRMMVAADRLDEAAPILDHIEVSGAAGTEAMRQSLAAAARRTAARPVDRSPDGPLVHRHDELVGGPDGTPPGDREALGYMVAVLGELLEDGSRSDTVAPRRGSGPT